MRTTRSLAYRGEGLCLVGSLSGGVSVQGGGICPGGVSVQGVLSPGGSLSREVSVQGGLCPGGVSVQGVSVKETPLPSWG